MPSQRVLIAVEDLLLLRERDFHLCLVVLDMLARPPQAFDAGRTDPAARLFLRAAMIAA
jgi:hypothetical protein